MKDYDENEKLKEIIAKNLLKYRKKAGITQVELAEKLMYSDKNISRWERGEAVPEVTTLKNLADIYGVTVNDFLQEEENLPKTIEKKEINKKNRLLTGTQLMITLLSVSLVWLVAIVFFFIAQNFIPANYFEAWKCFIIAIPVSYIVMLVFTSLWCTNLLNCVVVSFLIWSCALAIYVCVPLPEIWLIFLVAVPVQVLDILWFTFKKMSKEGRKSFFGKFKTSHKDKKEDKIDENVKSEN
jgi:transcriptional regulator with XRE-family HTH domain